MNFKLTHLSMILWQFSCPLSLFFIPNPTFPKGEGEEGNQKNQVLCINSKVFA